METSGQESFIHRIRSALGYPSHEIRRDKDLCTSQFTDATRKIIDRIKNRSQADRQQLLDRFIEMAQPINLKVIVSTDQAAVTAAIADLVKEKDPEWGDEKSVVIWQHPLIEGLNLAAALAPQEVPVYVTELGESEAGERSEEKAREQLRKHVVDAYIGISSADFCMAETATLVMRTRPGQARSVSLVPSIHVAVIYLDQIIADLKELYALLLWDSAVQAEGLTNCMTFISGPSKTADVEATMVHGAHGPLEVYVYVIKECDIYQRVVQVGRV
jgi:L-lactate dehydrogenase complex protein LldG